MKLKSSNHQHSSQFNNDFSETNTELGLNKFNEDIVESDQNLGPRMIDQNIASESESDIDFDFNKLAMRLERSTSIDLISQKSNITNKTNEEEPDDSSLKVSNKINRL